MIALLMLVSMSRCALPALCPSNDEILSAVRQRDDAILQAMYDQAAAEDPDSFTVFETDRIKRISDVLCGDRIPTDLPGNPPVITCKFTARYWSRYAHTVARMVRRGDRWEIDDALMVSRKAR